MCIRDSLQSQNPHCPSYGKKTQEEGTDDRYTEISRKGKKKKLLPKVSLIPPRTSQNMPRKTGARKKYMIHPTKLSPNYRNYKKVGSSNLFQSTKKSAPFFSPSMICSRITHKCRHSWSFILLSQPLFLLHNHYNPKSKSTGTIMKGSKLFFVPYFFRCWAFPERPTSFSTFSCLSYPVLSHSYAQSLFQPSSKFANQTSGFEEPKNGMKKGRKGENDSWSPRAS